MEEYLNDPNFEQNRIEYKTNKEIADRNAKNGVKPAAKAAEKRTSFIISYDPGGSKRVQLSGRVPTGIEQHLWSILTTSPNGE